MGFEHATTGVIIALLVLLAPVVLSIRRARAGAELFVRRIPGVDAVDEAVARSAELGRPVSFTTGLTGLGPVVYACLGVLSFISRKAAVFRSRLVLPQTQPEVLAVTEDTVREAYRSAGYGSSFDPRSLVYLSDAQFAFAAGYMGLIQRENVGAAFLFGDFTAESLILAEAGQQVGAMQIAASTSPEQVAFFICACDYTLIGEELFAASAYLTREPVQLGSLVGQDWSKLFILLTIVAGIVIATVNSIAGTTLLPEIHSLLSWSLW